MKKENKCNNKNSNRQVIDKWTNRQKTNRKKQTNRQKDTNKNYKKT